MVPSYSDMPISKTAVTGYLFTRGAVPKGVEAPRGASIVTSLPAKTFSVFASRDPMTIPLGVVEIGKRAVANVARRWI